MMWRTLRYGFLWLTTVWLAVNLPLNSVLAAIVTGIITYEDAKEQEKGQVDWYQWYLEARAYIASHGGLACSVGTSIVFSKSGQLRALSEDPDCQMSVQFKYFPIPEASKLPSIILPVRSHRLPAAAPEELNQFLGGSY
ncbi:MAG: hypothetical protein VKK59_07825 [Vampirovibrionales bacterium]|nr:hypothetical protein [Vampirovibrionales bacterium]